MSLVRLELSDDGIARLTLTRPEKRNAISMDLAEEFAAAVEVASRRGARCALLDADGPVFCAGADMGDTAGGAEAVDQVLDVLLTMPLHWTAVVRQPVLGAGLALIGACPSVLATPNAVFGLPELARGFFPSVLLAQQVALVGTRAAYDLAFSAEVVDAQRAHEIGLVNAVIDESDIQVRATEHAIARSARNLDGLVEGIAHWQEHVRRVRQV